MKRRDFKSMSVDELWSLHRLIASVLARKISAEKAWLEERLRQLVGPGAAPANLEKTPHARRPYPQGVSEV
jgi:DNA-binding protein H-NS